jgi:hypothetical protein
MAAGTDVNSDAASEEVKTYARLLSPEQLQTIRRWMLENSGKDDPNSIT